MQWGFYTCMQESPPAEMPNRMMLYYRLALLWNKVEANNGQEECIRLAFLMVHSHRGQSQEVCVAVCDTASGIIHDEV